MFNKTQTRTYLYLCFLVILKYGYCDKINVDDLEKYVIEEIEKTSKYELKKDSLSYKPSESKGFQKKDYGEFDFIIIGAGSTGTVLANRLSEIKNWNILLIEAGDFSNNFTAIPAVGGYNKFSKYNWGYYSVPQKTSCLGMKNAQCPYPRGRGVGGTTLLNGLIYSRGHPRDFNRWAEMGNPGWSYKEVLPYFKKSENFIHNNQEIIHNKYHGQNGFLNIEFPLPVSPQTNCFFEANKELGYNFTDINGPSVIGVTPSPMNIKHGKRQDGGTAFITPIIDRKNLKVLTNSMATKIIVENLIATGVEFVKNDQTYVANVQKEIILSAGTINSPQILMLSGIGPKEHLEYLNIPVKKDLEVGSILREHPSYFGLTFNTNYTESTRSLREVLLDYLKGIGPLVVPGPIQAVGFYQSSYANISGYPDLELLIGVSNCTSDLAKKTDNWKDEVWNATFRDVSRNRCIMIYPILLQVESVGSVKLKSNSPFDFPLIDPNHLSDKNKLDENKLLEAMKLALKLMKTESFKKINATLNGSPLPACINYQFLSDEYWRCAIKQMTFNAFHPVGTCPMGPNPSKGAVVDHNLKVHGIKQLRVVDASIFPFTLTGHPNAPCVMIGEKLADVIKKQYAVE